jgi:aldose 1-epimerase
MSVESAAFGTSKEGKEIVLYSIKNSKGMVAKVMNLGAILVELWVPDSKGEVQDLVLGFDKAESYYGNPSFFGATIGPNANRIGGATYKLDGVNYQLDVNDGENNLHSHMELGYHKRMWEAKTSDNSVTFTLEDPATLGFPGNKVMSVTYTVTEENELVLTYHAKSDDLTIINPTNHTYFNLDGRDAGSIVDHKIQLEAKTYTPTVPGSIPTGEIAPVAGTPMDLTKLIRVGDHIDDDFEQLTMAGGYDHNYCIDGWDGTKRLAATVVSEKSGRTMKVYTDLPGIQFYAGNFIADQVGKGGTEYHKRYALCLETQFYPDTIHHENFPSCVFGGDREYNSETTYRFE